jgi:hypothetical protein
MTMIGRKKNTIEEHGVLMFAVGAAAGITAGLWWTARQRWLSDAAPALPVQSDLDHLEELVVEALREDPDVGERGIDVAALSHGIVELTGAVETDEEADRAVAAAQRAAGVRTVLNRLDVASEEHRLASNRRRRQEGDPALTEAHRYASGVGMGARRQGATEPDRDDDSARALSRELGVPAALEQTSELLEKTPTAVEGHSIAAAAPTDDGTHDRAGHHRLGNVPAESPQELNPASGVHEEIKPGTRLTLEQAGLEREPPRRDAPAED